MCIRDRPAASFLLLHVPDGLGVRARLRTQGVAVRRGDTFPGLGSDWLRLAVRDHDTNARVAVAFSHALSTTALSTTALSTTALSTTALSTTSPSPRDRTRSR